jgi:hypothetical protein
VFKWPALQCWLERVLWDKYLHRMGSFMVSTGRHRSMVLLTLARFQTLSNPSSPLTIEAFGARFYFYARRVR